MVQYHFQCRWVSGWEARFANITWASDTDNRVMWRWQHEGMWTDLDGSLTGLTGGALPVYLVPEYPLLDRFPQCHALAGYNGSMGGRVCPGQPFRRLGFDSAQPWWLPGRTMFIRLNQSTAYAPYLSARQVNPNGWAALVPIIDDTSSVFEIGWVQTVPHIDATYFGWSLAESWANESTMLNLSFVRLPGLLAVHSPLRTVTTPWPNIPWDWNASWADWYLDNATCIGPSPGSGYWLNRVWWNDTGARTDTRHGLVSGWWQTYPKYCPPPPDPTPPSDDSYYYYSCGDDDAGCSFDDAGNGASCTMCGFNFTFDFSKEKLPPCVELNILPQTGLWSDPATWKAIGYKRELSV
jgi:hypothetical protein